MTAGLENLCSIQLSYGTKSKQGLEGIRLPRNLGFLSSFEYSSLLLIFSLSKISNLEYVLRPMVVAWIPIGAHASRGVRISHISPLNFASVGKANMFNFEQGK